MGFNWRIKLRTLSNKSTPAIADVVMAQERGGAVGKRKLQELAAEVCPRQVLDEDTEEVGIVDKVCKNVHACTCY